MTDEKYSTEVVIAGGGLAGLTTAFELLDRGHRVLLLDKDTEAKLGGLAKLSFGGVHMIGTPHQRRNRIDDSPDRAYEDWAAYAEFGAEDVWPKAWARFYCDNSLEFIYRFLDEKKIRFLPVVNWPEQGLTPDSPGNSVPRWHITWGTGHEIIVRLLAAIDRHPARSKLEVLFQHEVSGLDVENGRVVGVHGRDVTTGATYRVAAEHTVIAAGGICGGDLSRVRQHWSSGWGSPPDVLLNGAHEFGDGMLHDQVESVGGVLTHLDKQWHYAAGVHHPAKTRPHDGLSLVPPRSALWVNALGQRIRNPDPIVAYTDTRHLVESVLAQPGKYSWQVLNWHIAIKELAVSGCSFMDAFRYKKRLLFLKQLLFGNTELVSRLLRECPEDVISAESVEELVDKMNERNLAGLVTDRHTLTEEIDAYDAQVALGAETSDAQLRRIAEFRAYRGDRVRLARSQAILAPRSRPLIAIREFILARKSLGGIRTDLGSRVLDIREVPIAGLYAVGEAAGFGGGGIHGLRSLEGTFLGGCVLTGRVAGRAIDAG